MKSSDHDDLDLLVLRFTEKQKGTSLKLNTKAEKILFSTKGREILQDIEQHLNCEFIIKNAVKSLAVSCLEADLHKIEK